MALFQRLAIFMGALVVMSCYVHANEKDLLELDTVYNEKECVMQGGLCVKESDCPSEQLTAIKGLCPEQRSKGVECCYGLSVKETRCGLRGGTCMAPKNCGFAPKDKLAKNCQPDEVCCILLN